MIKRLKFSRIQMEPVPGQRALLTVKFLDDEGDAYTWAPRWTDIEKTFLKAINTEYFNKPDSEWLNRFGNTVREVVESVSQPIQDAYKVHGTFDRVYEGKLQITWIDHYEGEGLAEVMPGFAITVDFVGSWLRRDVDVLVINGIAVQISSKEPFDRYPPLDVEPDSEDLPF